MRNPEVLKVVLDHLKTKEMCKNALKKLLFVTRYVPDWYKTQKMCNKTVNTYHWIQFVPYYYKTQEICDRAVNKCFVAFTYIPDW